MPPELLYTLTFTEAQMEFFRQLFQSQMAVALQYVEVVAELKRLLLTASPGPRQPYD